MKVIDLNPYGILFKLQRGIGLPFLLNTGVLKTGSFSMTQKRMDAPSGAYTVGGMLGKGTYGELYQLTAASGEKQVVKVVRLRTNYYHSDIENAMKECIIHIILEKTTETVHRGPFVPRFYEVFFDPVRNLIAIRMEQMQGTLADVYASSTKEQNEVTVPETLGNLAHILNFYHNTVKFNHRDLYAKNVMYKMNASGGMDVRLIDFGFTCLTWQGHNIQGSLYFPEGSRCFLPSRDLSQFIYQIYMDYRHNFSNNTRAMLQDLLTFELNGKLCEMFKGCSSGSLVLSKWLDTYTFLDNKRTFNPKTVPLTLWKRMQKEMNVASPSPVKTSPIPAVRRTKKTSIKQCPPEKILNPATRRCVKRDGVVGRKLLVAQDKSPRQPIRRRIPTIKLKPCRADQLRSPKTRRCVKRDGKVAQRLIAEGLVV